MRRAVIDIGTVTTRLAIADCDGAVVDMLVKKAIITDLGEGLTASGELSEEAIGRVLGAVDFYVGVIESHGLDLSRNDAERPSVVAVATSAARDASNSGALADALAERGIPMAVIPGQREAEVAFLGATSDFPSDGILVADIGGGSTELILGSNDGAGHAEIRAWSSVDVGCRRLTEMFLRSDPYEDSEMQAALDWATAELQGFFGELGGDIAPGGLVAVGGTATSLVAVLDGMEVYELSKVHGRAVSIASVFEAGEMLASMSLAQRREVVGLQAERAPVMVAGLIILRCVMDLAGVDKVTVSESDGLKGIFLDWPGA